MYRHLALAWVAIVFIGVLYVMNLVMQSDSGTNRTDQTEIDTLFSIERMYRMASLEISILLIKLIIKENHTTLTLLCTIQLKILQRRVSLQWPSCRDEELYELEGEPRIGELTENDINQINKQYGCYDPNTSPGALHVRVLQAGPFQDPGHYYFCLKTRDANKNEQSKCSEYDPLRTTDPEWKTEFIFHSDVPFYSFDITIKKADKFILYGQTIWVESKEHADKYYTTMEQSVLYEYKIIE